MGLNQKYSGFSDFIGIVYLNRIFFYFGKINDGLNDLTFSINQLEFNLSNFEIKPIKDEATPFLSECINLFSFDQLVTLFCSSWEPTFLSLVPLILLLPNL